MDGLFLPLLIAFSGLFSLLGAVQNWNWFMNSSRARLPVLLLGRTGARIFYGVLGLGFFCVGLVGIVLQAL